MSNSEKIVELLFQIHSLMKKAMDDGREFKMKIDVELGKDLTPPSLDLEVK